MNMAAASYRDILPRVIPGLFTRRDAGAAMSMAIVRQAANCGPGGVHVAFALPRDSKSA
jgi:hypothetical protein